MDASASPAPSRRRLELTRDPRRGMLTGVSAGIARAFGIDPVVVRIAFVVTTIAWGLGLVVYGAAWLLMPTPAGGTLAGRLLGRRASIEVAVGSGLLVLSLLLLLRATGFWVSDAITWPIVVAVAGVALIWRPSLSAPAPAETAARGPSAPLLGGRARSAVALGSALVLGAALVFLWANGALDAAGDVVLAGVVVLVALALILAPLWWRLARSLATERAERIRSEERAELAAHLHDSVLQTLALVQRRADSPREVASLARRQERELRAWLQNRPTPEGGSLTTAIADAAAAIEDEHGAEVEVVAVGDCPFDARTEPIVAAAREAILNAAKFAGDAGPIDVFTEATADRISVFVRDRGTGFDPDAVPDERRGVRESIVGRMERHGGSAAIRSSAETGTEIELSLPRADR